MVNKKVSFTITKSINIAVASLLMLASILFVLSFVGSNVVHAQYGAGEYGAGEFSSQQTGDGDDDSDTTQPPDDNDQGAAEPGDDQSTGDQTEDELAETGQALSTFSIIVLVIVVIAAVSTFFIRPSKQNNK